MLLLRLGGASRRISGALRREGREEVSGNSEVSVL
jgi:hypothetical protein